VRACTRMCARARARVIWGTSESTKIHRQ